jgi:hypothetical protein
MFSLNDILVILSNNKIIANYKVLIYDEISKRSHYKIRCILIPSEYKLELKFIKIDEELIYSYQLFSKKPIIRWDNAPHYPNLKNYPHHFHNGVDIEGSNLTGNVKEDLKEVLNLVVQYITKDI